jgi:hypothetical protein
MGSKGAQDIENGMFTESELEEQTHIWTRPNVKVSQDRHNMKVPTFFYLNGL